MNRRQFHQTVMAIGAMAMLPVQAAMAKSARAVASKQRGDYAVFGFSETFMKKTIVPPFTGISIKESLDFINTYGIRDDVSGVVYVKLATLNLPNQEGGTTVESTGGLKPRYSAAFIAYCRDGKTLKVYKNRVLGPEHMFDPEYADKWLIPKPLHTTATRQLLVKTGLPFAKPEVIVV